MSSQDIPGPGHLAQPGPVGFMVQQMAVEDGSKIIVLRIEHTTGMTIVSMPTELARSVGSSLIEASTGLHLVQPGDMPGTI
jgi:hypothetical protein